MTDLEASATAQFHAMTEGTKADWDIIATEAMFAAQRLPDRVMDHLRLLDGDFGGFAVDRLTHSLQTATRAERAGRDDQYVLCAPYGTEPEEPAVCGGASLRGCIAVRDAQRPATARVSVRVEDFFDTLVAHSLHCV